jgi:hypothetical protein
VQQIAGRAEAVRRCDAPSSTLQAPALLAPHICFAPTRRPAMLEAALKPRLASQLPKRNFEGRTARVPRLTLAEFVTRGVARSRPSSSSCTRAHHDWRGDQRRRSASTCTRPRPRPPSTRSESDAAGGVCAVGARQAWSFQPGPRPDAGCANTSRLVMHSGARARCN